MTPTLVLAVVVILATIFFLARGFDVRLVLFAGGFLLCCIARDPLTVFDAFEKAMGDGTYVAPICSSLGFSSVLAAAGCDREMVRLLMRPLSRVPWLILPGGCLVGFLTNSAITSQTGAAAAVGPILVPLLIAAGFPPAVSGAALVLGCSGGGNLLNLGEPDFVAIQKNAGAKTDVVLSAMLVPLLASFWTAVGVFMLLFQRKREAPPVAATTEEAPIDLVKALLPPLPIVMLLVLQPRFQVWPWLALRYKDGLPVAHAMLVSTMIAFLIHRKEISAQARTFFEGMGRAYTHVISLIITGRSFIAGITAVGLMKSLVHVVSGQGLSAKLAAEAFPWALAVLSGSGIAPCVSFCEGVLPTIAKTDPTAALNLGVLAAVASNFGRTMSPVAAVVMFSSTLVKVSPIEIVKRTAPPLLAGGVVLLLIMLFR